MRGSVVSYWNSTSNHNGAGDSFFTSWLYLIEILHQTTTPFLAPFLGVSLYLIEILHQTTTIEDSSLFCYTLYLIEILHQTTTLQQFTNSCRRLYLIEILHQTTTRFSALGRFLCCILLKFYIKPQQKQMMRFSASVVSYWNSTSNHNYTRRSMFGKKVVSYWNSTSNHNKKASPSSQHMVVSYWNSTSNHNFVGSVRIFVVLYLIEILHQTTTRTEMMTIGTELYLIEILHQTTTHRR